MYDLQRSRRRVERAQGGLKVQDSVFHTHCMKCQSCQVTLTTGKPVFLDRQGTSILPYCRDHKQDRKQPVTRQQPVSRPEGPSPVASAASPQAAGGDGGAAVPIWLKQLREKKAARLRSQSVAGVPLTNVDPHQFSHSIAHAFLTHSQGSADTLRCMSGSSQQY